MGFNLGIAVLGILLAGWLGVMLIAADGVRIEIGVTWGVREIAAADTAEQALAEADAVMYLRKPHRRG